MSARWLVFAIALTAFGQPREDPIRAGVRRAQQQIQSRQWDEARNLLKMLDADCLANRNPRTCRTLVDYAVGYLNLQEAGTVPAEQRRALLEEARRRYTNVTVLQPENAAAFSSLALVAQGMLAVAPAAEHAGLIAEVIRNWEQAIRVDQRNSAQYRVSLGNFLLSQNRRGPALEQFQLAAEQAPHEETPRRRILENSAGLAIDQHRKTCTSSEAQFPELAVDCYERLIARLHAQRADAGPESEDVLLRWTSLTARRDALSLDRVNAIPRGWMTQPVDELRLYLEKPWSNARVWRWWSQPPRSPVMAEVATTMGRQALGNPQEGPPRAAQCWEGMLEAYPNLAEQVGEYDRPGRPAAGTGVAGVLRLYQELASLYANQPDLDPQGRKLQRMVSELFQGKGQFIMQQNWKATQPFHMVLAQIYLQRGVLNNGAAGAEFQLRAVLEDADRRFKDPKDQFFQPLPEIKAALADTYVKIGPNRTQDAMRLYVEAAKAYLDTDALDSARRMLSLVPAAGRPPQIQAAVDQVGRILQSRATPASAVAGIDAARTPWLFQPLANVPADFLVRQRFKLLSDAAAAAPSPERQLDSALGIYNLVTTERPVLVGTADAIRWHQSESRLLSSLNASAAKFVLAPDAGVQTAGVRLTLEGENRPTTIPVADETKVAASVVAMIGTRDLLRAKPFLTMNGKELVFTKMGNTPAFVDDVVGRVRQNPQVAIRVVP